MSAQTQCASLETDFYEECGEEYFRATVGVDMEALYRRFLPHLPPGGRILDVGSGSGRDTSAFLRQGYEVEAIDPSPTMASLSSDYTGESTRILAAEELEDEARFDGIWACASLLHVPRADLPNVFFRLGRALKAGGALFVSFKCGDQERRDERGRRFTDMNSPLLRELVDATSGLELRDLWETGGEGSYAGRDRWLNAILAKRGRSPAPI